LGGEWEELGPKPGLIPMTNKDVFAVSWQGGGGWGDPLERDPKEVAEDLRSGVVSAGAVKDVYGVVLSEEGLDDQATIEHRSRLREERVGEAERAPTLGDRRGGSTLGENLRLVGDEEGWRVMSSSGHVLSVGTTAWRAGAIARPLVTTGSRAALQLHPDLSLTAFYCPASGALLAVDLHEKGASPRDDVLLDLA
jgi:N-methylhydantoinase B